MHADVHRPFTTVNPLAHTWQTRGLDWLLLPHDVPQQVPVASQPPQRGDNAQAQVARQPRHQSGQQSALTRQAPVSNQAQQSASPRHSAPQANAQRENIAADPALPLQRAFSGTLPPIWAERLAATRRGLIVWTYAELGQDLLGVQSEALAARRAFLGQLLKDMNNPAGTHTFWPVMLPQALPAQSGESFVPNADAFWSGMTKLGARAVVAMGEAAVQALDLPEPLPLMQQMRYNGTLVLSVSDVAELLANNTLYRTMLTYVRTFLGPLIARAYPD